MSASSGITACRGSDSRRFCTDSPRVICYSSSKEKAPISDVATNKKDISERNICSKFIGPAVKSWGWGVR
jgi:hypothetical protein